MTGQEWYDNIPTAVKNDNIPTAVKNDNIPTAVKNYLRRILLIIVYIH